MKRIGMTMLIAFLMQIGTLWATTLEGVDIILIRGYSSKVAFDASMPKYDDSNFDEYWQPLSEEYWKYYTETLLVNNPRVANVYWSSKDRLTDGVIRVMVDRIMALLNEGWCANGCIMVTHSTGGLVADYLLSSALDSEGTDYDYKIIHDKTLLVMDLASANGGSELAELLRDVAVGVGCNNFVTTTLAEWIFNGLSCNAGTDSIGTTNDLVPSLARAINGSSLTFTPTIMVAGEGTSGLEGSLAHMILPGNDDSVVAMHSTCGGNTADPVDSCVSNMKPDGELTSVSAPSGRYQAHYPWIMTEEDHMEMVGGDDSSAHESLTLQGYGSFNTTESSSGWWIWTTTYRRISDDSKPSGQLIQEHFSF